MSKSVKTQQDRVKVFSSSVPDICVTKEDTNTSDSDTNSLGPIMENGGYLNDSSNTKVNNRRHSNGKRKNSKSVKCSTISTPTIELTPSDPLDYSEAERKKAVELTSFKLNPDAQPQDKPPEQRKRFTVLPVAGADNLNTNASILNRLKSSSDQNLHESSLKVPELPKRRSGSLASLTHRNSNKRYIPVPHEVNGDRKYSTISKGDCDTVNSFADFIKVKSPRKKSISTALAPFSYSKSPNKSRNMRRRLLYKNGECNVTHKHIRRVNRHYLADMFTTLIDLKWRWSLMIFIASFVLTWIVFAAIWFLIGYTHKDFEPENISNKNYKPCVGGVEDFTTAFLFSLETQHTIGYGTRAMNSECTEAVIVLMLQSIVGVMSQALVTGMVFAKISRPKKRAETLMFSKVATISQRDGHLCLMFRIGDMRNSHLVEAHVRALVVRRRVTKEGEVLPLDHQDVDLGFGDGTDRLLIIWPVIVIHKIDKNSPFWRMSKEDLERENFELIVILEGTIESTGMTTQARTSYLPSEIQWGRRLERLVTFQKEGGEYQVDYTWFDSTVPVDTPTCSARELAAQHANDSESQSSDEDFALVRTDSMETTDTEEDDLLLPEGGVALEMFETDQNGLATSASKA